MDREDCHNLKPIFGRYYEIKELLMRVSKPGITLITGRPQIGKSHLMRELERLAIANQTFIVGYSESTGERADLILRALNDLYKKWLSNSSYIDQAMVIYEREKKNCIGRIGGIISKLFSYMQKGLLDIKPLNSFGDVMEFLEKANEELKSGDIRISKLQYDQMYDLIATISTLSEKNIVLILDAFEQSPDISQELATLQTYLRNIEVWPYCHVVICMRNNTINTSYTKVEKLIASSPACSIMQIDKIDLVKDLETRDHVLTYLREKLEILREVDDDKIVGLIDGHPGVIYWWTYMPPTTLKDLIQSANKAHNLKYDELIDFFNESLLRRDGEKEFLARVSLFPEINNKDSWLENKELLLRGIGGDVFEQLQSKMILDPEKDYPSFGHTCRYEVAKTYWENEKRALPIKRKVLEYLLLGKCQSIVSVHDLWKRLSLILYIFEKMNLDGNKSLELLLQIVDVLMKGDHLINYNDAYYEIFREYPETGVLVAIAYFNVSCNKSDIYKEEALNKIRMIYQENKTHDLIISLYSKAICNVIIDLFDKRLDEKIEALVEELEQCLLKHESNVIVLRSLSKTYGNLMVYLDGVERSEECDIIFNRLHYLYNCYKDNHYIQCDLASKIYILISYCSCHNDENIFNWFEHLKKMYSMHKKSHGIARYIARSIEEVVQYHIHNNDWEAVPDLIKYLEQFIHNYDCIDIRCSYAKILLKLIEGCPNRGLFEECENKIVDLSSNYDGDDSYIDIKAYGFYYAINHAKDNNDRERVKELVHGFCKHVLEVKVNDAVMSIVMRLFIEALNERDFEMMMYVRGYAKQVFFKQLNCWDEYKKLDREIENILKSGEKYLVNQNILKKIEEYKLIYKDNVMIRSLERKFKGKNYDDCYGRVIDWD